MKGRVLIVDDDLDMANEMARLLSKRNLEVEACDSAEKAYELFSEKSFDVVVTDLRMPVSTGIDLCQRIVENRRDVPVIVMTGFGDLESAIATLRAGAFDFLRKPFGGEELLIAVERAVEHRALREEVKRLRSDIARATRSSELLGESRVMQRLREDLARLSQTDATVLITGESGVGKEVVARQIHQNSARGERPFVAINCAALPDTLLESELFGHVKGAFTDARSSRAGLFVEASGGTLLLDELGEMPLSMQAKLLRALEERRVRPLGSNSDVAFDTRILAATNRDLEEMVALKEFREDLFYRINVVQVDIPPLRTREGDALQLAQFFVEKYAERYRKPIRGFSPEVASRLARYSWPGNVRELQNCIDRAVTLARLDELILEDLPPRIRDATLRRSPSAPPQGEMLSLEELERNHIELVMNAVRWNKTEATRILGLDRSTLYRKLERYQLRPPPSSSGSGP